jgi:hypothetical protein
MLFLKQLKLLPTSLNPSAQSVAGCVREQEEDGNE